LICLACAQVLRFADNQGFLERRGLQLPQAFYDATAADRVLSDAAASACLGIPVAWQTMWHDGEAEEPVTRAGKRVDQIWRAHLQLLTEVRAPGLGFGLQALRELSCAHHAVP
jgi:hypothetical protein